MCHLMNNIRFQLYNIEIYISPNSNRKSQWSQQIHTYAHTSARISVNTKSHFKRKSNMCRYYFSNSLNEFTSHNDKNHWNVKIVSIRLFHASQNFMAIKFFFISLLHVYIFSHMRLHVQLFVVIDIWRWRFDSIFHIFYNHIITNYYDEMTLSLWPIWQSDNKRVINFTSSI